MISVCMGAYNGEKYIKTQLDSILSQIAPDDEVVISDDRSTDSTRDIILSYNDPRIRLIENPGERGTTKNAVNALMHAKGEAIFLADQDDIWLDGKYEKMTAALPGFDMVHHDSYVTDDDLNIICESLYALKHNGPGVLKNMAKGSFYGSHMLISRRLLDLATPFPPNIEVGHDLWIGLVASMTCPMNYIPDRLLYYRRHEGVHCDLFEPSPRPLSKKLYSRLVMLRYILQFKFKKPPRRY